MRSTVERLWKAHGLDCAVLRMDMGHRCGYVNVPPEHPWHGIAYNAEAPEGSADVEGRTLDDAGMGGMIALLGGEKGVEQWSDRIEAHVAVHGGLTFSNTSAGDLPEGWWFGFDCAHLDDTPDYWTEERVAQEVEKMAEQVAARGVGHRVPGTPRVV